MGSDSSLLQFVLDIYEQRLLFSSSRPMLIFMVKNARFGYTWLPIEIFMNSRRILSLSDVWQPGCILSSSLYSQAH